ncbi:serine/threonine-protein kinase [Nonomuraea sp. NPDC050394]|uniref:serine/threonine-protein kinase n=1 Tax=Nonomuraea sp. NPDC050394 TaxID=3364363 RepID=UPI0037B18B11
MTPSDPRQIEDYVLSEVLGRGGQGSVYLGEDPTGGKVAVKLLHTTFTGEADALRRFTREAETARRVAPFCTARVLAVGVAEARPYIVSEFVPGPSLEELVREQGVRSGSGLERLAVATLTALAAIHHVGVVHRDFKPNNVIMGPEGPVVIDFGISRALEQTATSSVMGTPAFMAPEQFAGTAGAAADMFSWASTMIYAATGRVAFRGDTMPAVMHAILTSEPDLSGVPEGLRALVARCLAKDPLVRPSAEELLARLTGRGMPATAWIGSAPAEGPREVARTLVWDGTPNPGPYAPGSGPNAPAMHAASGRRAGSYGPGPLAHAPGLHRQGPYGPAPHGQGPYAPTAPGQRTPQKGAASLPMAIAALICIGLLILPLLGEVLGWAPARLFAMGGMVLFMPVIGLALRPHNIGATITTMLTLPLGLVFLLWATVLGSEDHMPLLLLAFVPAILVGLLLAATALLTWRLSAVAAVLGALGGALLSLEVALYLLVEISSFDLSTLVAQMITALSRLLIIGWLGVTGIQLVRRAAT